MASALHLVQLSRAGTRAVAIVAGDELRVLGTYNSVYDLALDAIRRQIPLTELANRSVSSQVFDYSAVYAGQSEWRLLCPFDHPGDSARLMVSGTGLTHKVSAENRAAMRNPFPGLGQISEKQDLDGARGATACPGSRPDIGNLLPLMPDGISLSRANAARVSNRNFIWPPIA